MAGGTNTCETSTEKFASPSRAAWTTAMALAGAVVSKPTAKKTTCLPGILLGQADGVHGRVDDPHVAPFRLHREEVLGRARHPQHVAEGAEDHLRPRGDGHGLVDHLHRRDAHRAARAMDQGDLGRQHFIQPEAHDGVGLPAADLHDVPGPGRDPGDGRRQLLGGLGVSIFVDVFQGLNPLGRRGSPD